MSLILDALNRADQDRKNKNVVPDLQSLHQPAEHHSTLTLHKKIVGLLLLLIGLLVVGILLILWTRPVVELPRAVVISTDSVVPAVTEVPPASAQSVVTSAPAAAPPQAQQVDNLYSEPVTALPSTNAANKVVDQLYAAEEADPISEPVVVPLPEVAVAANRRLVSDPVKVMPAAAPSARYFALVDDVISFGDLPWNAKQQIPTISYSRHNYLPNNVSSVVINGQTAGEGNLVADHFVVEEILVDGVVLRVGDKRFKLKALNGWINM